MSAPTNLAEFLARYAENQSITGTGFDQVMNLPCPFCAAAGFATYPAMDQTQALVDAATCGECGRSAQAIYTSDAGDVRFQVKQTGGSDQPAWLFPQIPRA